MESADFENFVRGIPGRGEEVRELLQLAATGTPGQFKQETVMTVYVDRPELCRITEDWPFQSYARLYGDDKIELYGYARKLGLRSISTSDRTDRFPMHFMITSAKRRAAIALGAVPLDSFEIVRRLRQARLKNAS